jgi:pimeloyl-ACP methyl ester carboxylesterase
MQKRENAMTEKKSNKAAPSRRNLITTAAAGAALAVTAPMVQAQSAPKTFVLVHGGWHGGWCWRRVTDILERKGHKAFAPTLTGLGERSHLLNKDISTATHVADVVNLVKWERLKDFVLVGHSLGGFVVNDVAEEISPLISSIVFLDAFLPDVGDSALKTASQASRDAIAKAKADGILGTKPQTAEQFMVTDPKDREWVNSLCTLHPIQTLIDETKANGGREKIAKKTFIRAKGWNHAGFEANYQRVKTSMPTWKAYEVPCGHDVMVDMPDRLAEILLEVA